MGVFGSRMLGVHFLLMVEHFGAWSQVWPRLSTETPGKREASRCSNEPEREHARTCVCVCVCVFPSHRMSECAYKILESWGRIEMKFKVRTGPVVQDGRRPRLSRAICFWEIETEVWSPRCGPLGLWVRHSGPDMGVMRSGVPQSQRERAKGLVFFYSGYIFCNSVTFILS